MRLVELEDEYQIKIGHDNRSILPLVRDIRSNGIHLHQGKAWYTFDHMVRRRHAKNIHRIAVLYRHNVPIAWVIKWAGTEVKTILNQISHPAGNDIENATYWRYTKPQYRHRGFYHKLKSIVDGKLNEVI
jgi:hypothetical protein